MALISLRQLLDHAAEFGYCVPAFNVNNMEQVLAIMEAARNTCSPVILQVSRGARSYAGDAMIRQMVAAAVESYPEIPVVLHQDHGSDAATCFSAIQNGFTSVMMDGSLKADGKTPSTFKHNLLITGHVTKVAHDVGVSVEGELGCIGSLETGKDGKEDGRGLKGSLDRNMLLTDPEQAVDFVSRTKVDALAVAIGTSHGANKFTRKPTGDILAMDVVKAIHDVLPDTHLVMHGSSSVPQELQDVINSHGGEMPQAFGVPLEEIVEGIRHGVRKVNIDTDCRLAMAGQIRRIVSDRKAEFDPRKFLGPAMGSMRQVCEDRYERFGAAGKASQIKPITLSDMAKRYASGELAPRIKARPVAAKGSSAEIGNGVVCEAISCNVVFEKGA